MLEPTKKKPVEAQPVERQAETKRELVVIREFTEPLKRKLAREDYYQRLLHSIRRDLRRRKRIWKWIYPKLIKYYWNIVKETKQAWWEGVWEGKIFPYYVKVQDSGKKELLYESYKVWGKRLAFWTVVGVYSFWLLGRFSKNERVKGVFPALFGFALVGGALFGYWYLLNTADFWESAKQSKAAEIAQEQIGTFDAFLNSAKDFLSSAGLWLGVLSPFLIGLGVLLWLSAWKVKREFAGFKIIVYGKLDKIVDRKRKDD